MKSIDKLTLADDFMFARVFSIESVAKHFLEQLLGIQIDKIVTTTEQLSVKDTYSSLGARFDVYARDGKGTVYNIEMQNRSENFSFERMRYYHSSLDIHHLQVGNDYTTLPKTFVIFVCQFNPFPDIYWGVVPAKYELVTCIKDGAGTLTEIDTGAHTIILSTKYTVGNVEEDIEEFLKYLDDPKEAEISPSYFVQQLNEHVIQLRSNETVRRDYMSLDELIKAEREEALQEGKALGAEEMELKNACALLETIPSISTAEELSKILRTSIEVARKAFAIHKTSKGVTKMDLQ